MRIIDIGAALGCFPKERRTFAGTEDLLGFMDKYMVSDAVVYHTDACRVPKSGNALLLDMCKNTGGRLHPCLVLDQPLDSNNMGDADWLREYIKQSHPSAVRMFPHTQKTPFSVFYCDEVLSVLNELEIPLILDNKEYDYNEFPPLIDAYKKIKFILLRPGLNRARPIYALLRKSQNTYFDISTMCDAGLLEELVMKFGDGRFLFSAGIPCFEPCGPLGTVMYAKIADHSRERILAENWLELEKATLY